MCIFGWTCFYFFPRHLLRVILAVLCTMLAHAEKAGSLLSLLSRLGCFVLLIQEALNRGLVLCTCLAVLPRLSLPHGRFTTIANLIPNLHCCTNSNWRSSCLATSSIVPGASCQCWGLVWCCCTMLLHDIALRCAEASQEVVCIESAIVLHGNAL